MAREMTPPARDNNDAEVRLALNKRVRRGLWILAITLLVAGGLMCYLMASVLRAAGNTTDPERREFLGKLALICFLMVLWDFVLLIWVAWRIIAYRLRPAHHGPTPYVNAWALAGRRFRLRNPTSMPELLSDDGEPPPAENTDRENNKNDRNGKNTEDGKNEEDDENNHSGWRESP